MGSCSLKLGTLAVVQEVKTSKNGMNSRVSPFILSFVGRLIKTTIFDRFGRFLGDGISKRIGSIKLVTLGALIAIIGFVLVLSEITVLAITGFALNGLGFSVMVPELFRIGGTIKGVESSKGVAFIAGTGYFGFLLGPVILGLLAEKYRLTTSFWTLLICAIIVLVLTTIIKSKRV